MQARWLLDPGPSLRRVRMGLDRVLTGVHGGVASGKACDVAAEVLEEPARARSDGRSGGALAGERAKNVTHTAARKVDLPAATEASRRLRAPPPKDLVLLDKELRTAATAASRLANELGSARTAASASERDGSGATN